MSLRLPLLVLALCLPLASSCVIHDDCDDLLEAPGAYAALALRSPDSGVCEYFGYGGGGGGGTCGDYQNQEADIYIPDWASCDGFCESLGEADCLAALDCRGAYLGAPACEDGCPDIQDEFFQCWAVAPNPQLDTDCSAYAADECTRHNDCVSVHARNIDDSMGAFAYCSPEPVDIDPGSCLDQIACDEAPPECPADTIPGLLDGCWTGYCIPIADCDGVPTCESLAENSCVGRSDCTALYEGIDCTCNGESCTCTEWTYDACEELQP